MNTLYRNFTTIALLLLFAATLTAQSRGKDADQAAGVVQYTLPVTVLHLEVETKFESYQAGPYAKYALKYLGIEVALEDAISHSIESIELTPYIEADPTLNYFVNLGEKNRVAVNFFELTNQGLIMWADSYSGKSSKVLYPTLNGEDLFNEALVTPGTTLEEATLYKSVRSESGVERTTVKQSQTVIKGVEKRAEEAANQIFNLRKKKIQIITGDTDATFSGDALRAAVEELNRLEEEYLALFLGKKSSGIQKASFDVVPNQGNDRQIYIAFRLSERSGALPAGNLSGRPIVLELSGSFQEAEASKVNQTPVKGSILYRRPIMVTAKLSDGQQSLLESRVPIYQLGVVQTFSLESVVGKIK